MTPADIWADPVEEGEPPQEIHAAIEPQVEQELLAEPPPVEIARDLPAFETLQAVEPGEGLAETPEVPESVEFDLSRLREAIKALNKSFGQGAGPAPSLRGSEEPDRSNTPKRCWTSQASPTSLDNHSERGAPEVAGLKRQGFLPSASILRCMSVNWSFRA